MMFSVASNIILTFFLAFEITGTAATSLRGNNLPETASSSNDRNKDQLTGFMNRHDAALPLPSYNQDSLDSLHHRSLIDQCVIRTQRQYADHDSYVLGSGCNEGEVEHSHEQRCEYAITAVRCFYDIVCCPEGVDPPPKVLDCGPLVTAAENCLITQAQIYGYSCAGCVLGREDAIFASVDTVSCAVYGNRMCSAFRECGCYTCSDELEASYHCLAQQTGGCSVDCDAHNAGNP